MSISVPTISKEKDSTPSTPIIQDTDDQGTQIEAKPEQQEKVEVVEQNEENDAIIDDYNFEAIQNQKADEIFNDDKKTISSNNPNNVEEVIQMETQQTETETEKEEDNINTEKSDSPILDKTTKLKLLNLGQSLDSKQLTDALGYIDLRLLLRCFAKAVMRHIKYSQGYLFSEDLKMAQSQQEELSFTYGQEQNMKIVIDPNKKRDDEVSKSKNLENFNKMKEIMGNSEESADFYSSKFSSIASPLKNRVHDYVAKDGNDVKDASKNEETKQYVSTDTFTYTKDSNLDKTDPMIASLNRSLMHKGTFNSSKLSETGGGVTNTMTDSLALSQTEGMNNLKKTVKQLPMEAIQSEDGDSNSQVSSNIVKEHKRDNLDDSDEEINDDIERYEEIDLKSVSVGSSAPTPGKPKHNKALLSHEEIERIKLEREAEESEKQQRIKEFANKCKELIEKGEYNKSEFDNLIDESNLFESAEVLDLTSKQGFSGYIETQMLKFHPNYDFNTEQMNDDTGVCQSSHSLAQFYEDE